MKLRRPENQKPDDLVLFFGRTLAMKRLHDRDFGVSTGMTDLQRNTTGDASLGSVGLSGLLWPGTGWTDVTSELKTQGHTCQARYTSTVSKIAGC